MISTHTPHARRDEVVKGTRCKEYKFQLTRLMRGVTSRLYRRKQKCQFQLTRLMRGVTFINNLFRSIIFISTHTPHARRDFAFSAIFGPTRFISTHTPHARRDGFIAASIIIRKTFQLTRLMRGVTYRMLEQRDNRKFQLTRLMRGVTRKIFH